jgi:tetratricopeptide (TPR) repeat protein
MRARAILSLLLLASTAPVAAGAWASGPIISAKLARPVVAAPADWVVPASIPAAPPAADGAATVDLLSDTQIRFTKDGDSNYFAAAFKIASAQGLGDAALEISWDPALETLTLHRYRILRDGKVLDLLGDGSKLSVIQRETNMEDAALDGRLTVTMQPDDVRVGDVIDVAYTRTRRDPALGGRSEALTGPRDGNPYGRLRVRMIWPSDKKLQWRATPGVLVPRLVHSAAGNELLADLTNVTTPVPPRGAPPRIMVVNAIDVSELPDRGAVTSVVQPLYAAATKLGADSPVRAQAKRIAAATSDPKARAEMALTLVQEQIRYLFLGMDDGGYVPANADLTWSRRFGDCKAKTVLLVALLDELGIDAEPVLVNTQSGDFVAKRLPAMGAFDHVIVRATIGGKTYWLDGTRLGDTKLDRLRTPPYSFGLPIAAGTKGLIALTPEAPTEPSETISLALDSTAGIDAPAKATGEMRFREPSATDMRMKYADLSAADRETELRKLWRKNYDFVSPSSITTRLDERTGDFVIAMTGTARMDWFSDANARWYEVDRARLGWKFDIDREGTLGRDAPYQIDYPDYWESRETIKLPAGGVDFKLQGGSVDRTVGEVYAFHREVGIKDGVLTMESSTRALAPELPADKAEQTRIDMTALANSGVYVRVPDDYMATAGDLEALKDNKTGLVTALVHRGAVHFDRQELADSVADEDAAIALDPDNAMAHAVRALALAVQGDARSDAAADRALALDSKQTLAWRAKGITALNQGRYSDADKALSQQLVIDPQDARSLVGRATARLVLGRYADSLADLDAALAISPTLPVRIVRATALAGLGRVEQALAEADRAVDADPDSETNRKGRAELRANLGKRDLAIEDYNQLIEHSPSADYYLARAALWPSSDHAKRNADVNAALRLEPGSTRALALRASNAIDSGDFRAAEADVAALQKGVDGGEYAYQLRVQLLEKQGRSRDALEVVDSYVAKHPGNATALNERCWIKATLNLQIETALADCNESLKIAPDRPATLDSRAFANLRLGQIDAAISDYDAALKLAPALPASLYGRAIARARKGDEAGARADLEKARALSPDIEQRFAGFGVELPVTLARASK